MKPRAQRKAMIFVSNGFTGVESHRDDLNGDVAVPGSCDGWRKLSTRDQMSALASRARRANVTIYAIDPRMVVAGADLDAQLNPEECQKHVALTQRSLRLLADQTGGFAHLEGSDVMPTLKRIRARRLFSKAAPSPV